MINDGCYSYLHGAKNETKGRERNPFAVGGVKVHSQMLLSQIKRTNHYFASKRTESILRTNNCV